MNQSTYFENIKRIAILSFQDSRRDLIEWSYANKHVPKNHIIISTAHTATLLEGTLNIPVLNLEHGRSGGYQQVRSLLQDEKIDMILFFGNTAKQENRDSWFDELVNVAITKDAVVGYNPSTIDMLLKSIDNKPSPESGDLEFIHFLRSQVAKEANGVTI